MGWNQKVNANVFLVIIVFALIFFIFGLLHLLIRCLMRAPRTRDTDDDDELNDVTALEGQLQQLFHLHDSGIDQAHIDTFPVFNYNSIVGLTVSKSPFDCAVCLSEFGDEDKLRLLPKCSHAFHIDCIDTWLLSHSTCPLCRVTLFPDNIVSNRYSSPVVLVLESGSENSSREIGVVDRVNSHLTSVCCTSDYEFGGSFNDGIRSKDEENREKTVQVKLGKFRDVDGGGCSSSDNNVECQRRCFSMGSFSYVMDENSTLQVPITTITLSKKMKPLTSGHRVAMSECGRDSRREFNEFVGFRSIEESEGEGVTTSKSVVVGDEKNKGITLSGKESFSISKIWMKGWKEKQKSTIEQQQSSRRAVSFRFPLQDDIDDNGVVEESKRGKGGDGVGGDSRRAISSENDRWWEKGGSNEYDVEMQSCNSMDSQANHPSFARKTLLWLMGSNVVTQNKVVHSSF